MRTLIALALLLLAGCTNTIALTVALPADTPPTVVEPQTKNDSWNL